MDQICTICGEPGHVRKKCNLCTMCFEPGHKASTCPNPPVNKSPYQKMMASKQQKGAKTPQSAAASSSSSKAATGGASSSKAAAPAAQTAAPQPYSAPIPYREKQPEEGENPSTSKGKQPAEAYAEGRDFYAEEPRIKIPNPNVIKGSFFTGRAHNPGSNTAPKQFNGETTRGKETTTTLTLKNPKDLHRDGQRPGFNDSGQKFGVLTNHFPVQPPPETIYKYSMKLEEHVTVKGRKELRRVWVAIKKEDDRLAKNARVFPEGLRWATDMDSLWSLDKLNLPGDSKDFNVSIQREVGGMTRKFDVTVTHEPQATLRYRDIYDLSDTHPGATMPRGQHRVELARAFNALVSRFLVAHDDEKDENTAYATQVGANRFFINAACHHLTNRSNELVLYANHGYFMSVRPGAVEPLLNINTATTAFYAPIKVSEFMTRLDLQSNVSRLTQALRGKKAKICYQRSKARLNQTEYQIVRITGFGESSERQSFTRDGVIISVANYFERELHVRLNQPRLPCVNIGANDKEKAQWIPAECLQIVPWQPAHHNIVTQFTDQIMKIACRYPAHNLNIIANNAMRDMMLKDQPAPPSNSLPQFGISSALLEVEAMILQSPRLSLKNETGPGNRSHTVSTPDRAWRVARFIEAPPIPKSRVNGQERAKEFFDVINLAIDTDRMEPVSDFSRVLGEAIKRTGMPFRPRTAEPRMDIKPQMVRSSNFPNDIEAVLRRVPPNSAFAVVVLPQRSIPHFQMIKVAADCKVGLPVFVCLAKNVRGNHNIAGYCSTFSLKICTRMSGKTHIMEDKGSYGWRPEETLIMGADVTHPQPGSPPGTPSIAAVVANTDESWMNWPGSLTIQESRKEIISDIEAMAGQRMIAWRNKHLNSRMKSIIYYRDGVSESQYDDVLRFEAEKIASAHSRVFPKQALSMTVVICVKRHHVRFYHKPGDQGPKPQQNLPAGTLVERKVTDAWRFDWFLQSHHAGIGTARSTHYVVVRNDMKMGPAQIQALTNNLCYVWGRASKPVSLVPPAFYADILCERGRCYLRPWLHPEMYPPSPLQQRQVKKPGETEDAFRYRVLLHVAQHCWMKGERGGRISSPSAAHGPWCKELDGTMFYI